MAGARGRLRKAAESATPRRSARKSKNSQQDEGIPDVFKELLHDAQAAEADEDDRPRKKRRTAQPRTLKSPIPETGQRQPPLRNTGSPLPTRPPSTDVQAPANIRIRQTIEDSDESDDDSDVEWENALEDENDSDDAEEVKEVAPQIGDINIAIGGKKTEDSTIRRKVRRRAITSVDKKRRLDIHKMYLMCLLYHVHRRNAWCNDRRVQSTLRKIVSPTILANLVPNPDLTQYSASKRFVDGMNELKLMWTKRFKITAQGMYKPRWADAEAEVRPFSDFDDLDDPMDKDDFRNAAFTLRGSQDVGAQLFCALLRGIGIEVRLVCSLQPLPFASAAERATPQKPSTSKTTIVVDPYNRPIQTTPTRPKGKKLSRMERVMGERHTVLNKSGVAPKKQKAYHAPYPVYWVEAFNAAHQKWVPIDTHSTFTVNTPEKLEPPLVYTQSSLTYAIAFDEDHTAKDVTRRYAKAYSAKTRKFRVECTPGGEKWWKRVMKFFQRSSTLDRDQIEDATLARKVAAEGIPKNVQDFKGHPVYVLERHLKYNEVIHPLEPVGKVNCGTGMNPKMELIYRRSNVHLVRTADKWYRMGRDVKGGEQPLRHAKPKKSRRGSLGPDADVDAEADQAGAALYADFQTELYIPPPVVKGRVPRNVYGNLDLYVPSMCPPGGTHIRHKLASKAARILGVDSADAVTGFSFKGRHGTAIVQGVVVATEYADAVTAVIEGMEYAVEEAEAAAKRAESLRLWRRFFLGLRIAQRVNDMVIDGERGPRLDVQDEIGREDRELAAQEMAGGFFPDEGDAGGMEGSGYKPPAREYGGGGGFVLDGADDGGGFIPDVNEDHDEGGGFVPETEVQRTVPGMIREYSFESAILDSQTLRPRRRSSFGETYSSEDDGAGGGFLPGDYVLDDDDPADLGDGSDQVDGGADDGGGFILDDVLEKDKELSDGQDDASPSRRLPEITEDVAMTTKTPTPTSSPSEAGSLLLEDPEDEDADPDWLVDAT
ncbi:Rad4-domain-containing protein [Plenodomus tracheiphilus IPT5]|uniref:Rad4-domain-containing protein n=1 Tax=Plenodomus tracheiphilus IPT5 TaxID=1408161 RepID=A0A6A7B3M7_9PLEO|nr:Rad4-domain-containing protein [Plenodomus tracheiphilus IPT5]